MKENCLRYTIITISGGLIVTAVASFIAKTNPTLLMALVSYASAFAYLIIMDMNEAVSKRIRGRVLRAIWYLVVTGVMAFVFAMLTLTAIRESLTLGYYIGSFMGVFIARLGLTVFDSFCSWIGRRRK